MKKAFKVLGIIGGAIAIMCSVLLIVTMAVSSAAINNGAVETALNEAVQHIDPGVHTFFDDFPGITQGDLAQIIRMGIGAGFGAVMAFAIIALIGGALALAGGIIRGNDTLSGIFLTIGAVFTAPYCVTFILLCLASIFAFIQPKQQAQAS